MSNTSSSFHMLDSRIQKWIWNQDWSSLKDIQESSIPIVLKRDGDVIISAATAGGKTEAAFLPILTHILQNGDKDGYQVLYISPLKALINDQHRRLSEITSELNIDIIPWHGDIDAARKQKSLRSPNGIIIITPESLESFFINRKQHLTRAFSTLKYIVVDELHSFIGTERGKQLQSLMSRVEQISQKTIPRIAMSATFSDYDIARQFLRIDNSLPCRIPSQGESNHEIKILVKEYLSTKNYQPEYDIAQEIYSKLRGSNNLVFANSRQDVEQYGVILSDMCSENTVPNEFRVHHGNLSKIERESVEHELQKGEYPVTTVCTSTLELGVDIGKVKSISQIGTAFSVSGLRQRLGRSGRRGEASILRVFSIESQNIPLLNDFRAALFQNIAIIELLIEKRYESPSISSYHFSTLIQQILSLIAQYGSFQPKEAWTFLCKNGAFRNVPVELFLELLRSLGSANIISQLHTGQIIISVEGEKILSKRDFYVAFNTSIDYTIINNANSRRLGTIQYIPNVGDSILLAGRRWIVDSLDEGNKNIMVSLIKQGGNIHFTGEEFDIDRLITQKMLEIYKSNEDIAYLDIQSGARERLKEGRNFFAGNVRDNDLFMTYGNNSIFMTWAGTKINRTIALLVENNIGRKVSYDHIAVHGISKSELLSIIDAGKPSEVQLAELLNRPNKEKQKYDYLLSDQLLNMEYAASYLDADVAWEIISTEIK